MHDLDMIVLRMQFSAKVRSDFYVKLSRLLANGVLLKVALQKLYAATTQDGKKTRHAEAVVLRDCLATVDAGRPLSHALARWTKPDESGLIAAGEQSGNLRQAFADAIGIVKAKRRITGAVLLATVYPTFLLGLGCVLLHMISTKLVPKLVKVAPPENWEGAAALLYAIATYVNRFGLVTLILLLALVGVIVATLPHFKGPLRVYADRLPPWSIYRMLHGSTWLKNVAALVQAGIQLQDALAMLGSNASPWLKERTNAALYGIRMGANLGVALERSGYQFPDKDAVSFLAVMASTDGFDDAINTYADEWMNESVTKVQLTATAMLGLGILAIGVLMLIVVAGTGGIEEAIQAGVKG